MLWVSVVIILSSVETCLASEGVQHEGPQFVIWLQEPFSSSIENHLGNDSILAILVMLSLESFLLGF